MNEFMGAYYDVKHDSPQSPVMPGTESQKITKSAYFRNFRAS